MRKWHKCNETALNLGRNKPFILGAVSARGSGMTHFLRTHASAIRIMGPVPAA
jgi:hypothetical protein